jgi:hypothetical protein
MKIRMRGLRIRDPSETAFNQGAVRDNLESLNANETGMVAENLLWNQRDPAREIPSPVASE